MALLLFVIMSPMALFLAYQMPQYILHLWNQERTKNVHGCKNAKKLPQLDPFCGTDVVIQNLRAAKRHGFLRLLESRHAKMGL
jgi:hypothetical protein